MIKFYGLIVGLAILIGAEASERVRHWLVLKNPLYAKFSVWDFIWWGIIPGLFGARAYHVIDYWHYYAVNPEKILAIWEGGVAIYGGLLGGILGLGLFAWKRSWEDPKSRRPNVPVKDGFASGGKTQMQYLFLPILDVVAIGLPLGQAIGRLGNFFNKELYGLPTSLPWGIYLRHENRLPGYARWDRFHPLFAYEAVWNLAIFLLLLYLIRKNLFKIKEGAIFFTYIGIYGLGRFFLDFLRLDPWYWGALTVAQWLSLIAIASSLGFFVKKYQSLKVIAAEKKLK